MNKVNSWNSAEARLARAREDSKEQARRSERMRERVIDHLRLDMTSLGQQFTGMSVICTFISSIVVALVSLANDIAAAGLSSNMLTLGQIMWYLSLVYSLTIAIASGASAVFAFARANGSLDGDGAQRRVDGDRIRMRHMVRGFGVCIGIAVALLFGGLVSFVWAAHDRWVMMLVGATILPLWVWLIFQVCGRGEGEEVRLGWKVLGTIPWSSWSISKWRRGGKEGEKEIV